MENPYFALLAYLNTTDSGVARLFGRSRQAIGRWRRAGIPSALALEVEIVTAGCVRADDILRFASLHRVKRRRPTQPSLSCSD